METSEDFIWIQSWSLHQEPSLGKSDDVFSQNIKTVSRPGGKENPEASKVQFILPVLRISPFLYLLLSDLETEDTGS